MKVRVNVNKEAAVKAGRNIAGVRVVDIDVTKLDGAQRTELLNWGYSQTNEDGPADFDLASANTIQSPRWAREVARTLPGLTTEDIAAFLTRLAERRAVVTTEEEALAKAKATEEAEELRVVTGKVEAAFATLSAMTPEERFLDATLPHQDDEHRCLRYQHPLADEPVRWPHDHRVPSLLRPMLEDVKMRLKHWNEDVEAKEHQAKLDWAKAKGSKRLQRMLEEEIECDNVYRDERLDIDRPGWVLDNSDINLEDPRNVPEGAFDLLDAARVLEPEAWLQYCRVMDEDGNAHNQYVAVALFEASYIVFGIKSPVAETV